MGKEFKGNERIGEELLNNQGCLMKIVEYVNSKNIIVEFQDEYKCKIHTDYQCFKNGSTKNPYFPHIYNVGITGNKYSTLTKEYVAWRDVIKRCFDKKFKEKHSTYIDASCCEEWLLYENFYEWLHKQENFDKWLNGNRWSIDKDILVKGNKVYSPDTCCLVPDNVNLLFSKRDNYRGELPIGVKKDGSLFSAMCSNQLTNKREHLGMRYSPEKAFYLYKEYKENLIKQIAQIEYDKCNITKQCYDAMMNYIVEITD